MEQASVGFHCPECVKAGAKRSPVYTARTLPSTQTWAVFLLMGINVAVFLIGLAGGANAMSGGGGSVYVEGVLYAGGVASGEWYRLVSSGFLHYGIIHLGMNMFALYIVGPQLERRLGGLQFLALCSPGRWARSSCRPTPPRRARPAPSSACSARRSRSSCPTRSTSGSRAWAGSS
jgi:hypothetical protein